MSLKINFFLVKCVIKRKYSPVEHFKCFKTIILWIRYIRYTNFNVQEQLKNCIKQILKSENCRITNTQLLTHSIRDTTQFVHSSVSWIQTMNTFSSNNIKVLKYGSFQCDVRQCEEVTVWAFDVMLLTRSMEKVSNVF